MVRELHQMDEIQEEYLNKLEKYYEDNKDRLDAEGKPQGQHVVSKKRERTENRRKIENENEDELYEDFLKNASNRLGQLAELSTTRGFHKMFQDILDEADEYDLSNRTYVC
jgi:uncharacterized protein YjgD (DUF1641 family)